MDPRSGRDAAITIGFAESRAEHNIRIEAIAIKYFFISFSFFAGHCEPEGRGNLIFYFRKKIASQLRFSQ
jgi:hypothetical protein